MANAPETESDDEYEEFNKKDTDEEPEEEEEQMVSLKDIDAESKPEDDNVEDDNYDTKEEKSLDDWFMSKRKRIRESDADNIQKSLEEKQLADMDEEAAEEFKKQQEESKDQSNTQETKEEDDDEEEEKPIKLTPQEKNIQKISQTGRLFLRNILYSATEDDFKELFSPFGELEEVHVAVDTRTGLSKANFPR
ncbi:unnamed protein product [Ambrosiozyma monospora]|uniref:Unnamed protein product n=1 Tax=Ambrosiozyma monospora TaxID=43982 RepID=A0ACB5UAR7_AMBMO|nr:unnamed protein product [Ambrosiozyma monospora]